MWYNKYMRCVIFALVASFSLISMGYPQGSAPKGVPGSYAALNQQVTNPICTTGFSGKRIDEEINRLFKKHEMECGSGEDWVTCLRRLHGFK